MDEKPPLTEDQDLRKYHEAVAMGIDTLVGVGVSYSTRIKQHATATMNKEESSKLLAFADTLYEAAALLAKYRVETFGAVSEDHLDSVSEMFHIGGSNAKKKEGS